jgi:hypothetical protein
MATQDFQPWDMVWFSIGLVVWTIALFRIINIVPRAIEQRRYRVADLFVLTFWAAVLLGSTFRVIAPLIH